MIRARRVIHTMFEESAFRTARFLISGRAPDRAESQDIKELARQSPAEVVNPDLAELAMDPEKFPPIIFQTWKSRTEIPANYRYWRQSFVVNNPDMMVILWDDHDNRAMIERMFAWFLPVYDAYPREIFRADAIRLFFLFQYGGLYADLDSECLRPVAKLAGSGDVVLCRMGGNPAFDHAVPNAVMASKPGQMFWLLGMKRMIEMSQKAGSQAGQGEFGPEQMTGPVLLKRTYDEYSSLSEAGVRARIADILPLLSDAQRGMLRHRPVTMLPANRWYPLDWTNSLHKILCNRLRQQQMILARNQSKVLFPHADIVTYWSHSW